MPKVRITRFRRGGGVVYRVGDIVTFSPEKAASAVSFRWAEYVDEKPTRSAQQRETATAKGVETRSENLDTVAAVMEHFGSDAKLMKAYAEKEGISIPGRTKKAATIARYIAEHSE